MKDLLDKRNDLSIHRTHLSSHSLFLKIFLDIRRKSNLEEDQKTLDLVTQHGIGSFQFTDHLLVLGLAELTVKFAQNIIFMKQNWPFINRAAGATFSVPKINRICRIKQLNYLF